MQCKDLLGRAIILKTEGVQSIVALAEAVKAFRKMPQLLIHPSSTASPDAV